MFRRSRFNIRPNVSTAGRVAAAATPQEAPSVKQEASETPKDVSESSTATAVTDNKSVVTPSEKPTAPGDGNDQNGEATSSSAVVQRRKRFSVKPKVAPGRPSSLARTPKSPVKAISETPVEVPVSDLEKPTTSGQAATTAAPQALQSPRRRRPSEESKQSKVHSKPTLIPSDGSGPSAVPPAEDPQEQTHPPADSDKQLESTSGCQVKEVPSRLVDQVPPSLPNKEAIEISEKAKTLVTSKSGPSLSPPAFSLSRLLNDPSDIHRLEKARKLRELLRHEMHKEKKIKKAKARVKEFTLDPAKMTMRDLIRYLPVSNPMTSSLEDPVPENETVVPPSPGREDSPERAQEPEVPPKIASPRGEEEEGEEEEEEAAAAEAAAEAEEEQEESLMVPQVKVAEDGSLIIDEESLTVEVQRAKGPNLIQDRDPIFERGSTTTYSSFRKGTYSKPWSSEETDMFFLAISMVGTDFSMICQLFPHRARSEIKNKFKKEERENAWRIDKAFRERRKLDIEYFSKLLEKILEVQKNRKKLKSLAEKNSPKKRKRKANGKKAARKLSDVEEEDEEEESEIPDLEEEGGEKENEDLCNEGGTPVSKPMKKRKRKNRQDALTEEPDKKNKTGEKSNEQDEVYIPEDAEATLPEDHTNSDMSEKTENVDAAKDAAIKPAKLSRGRAPKPLLPLGRKWGKKPLPPSTKAKDKGDESGSDGATEEQVKKDASPINQASKRRSADDDISSEEEETTIQPPRPTRYGRVPKPTKSLTYPAKDDAQSSASETTPSSPAPESTASAAKPKPKCTAKRGRSSKTQSAQESKKPKLITLRASQSEYSDEENENQWEEEEVEEEQLPACSSSKDSSAPAFVPASLRSPQPVISEVEETMEELDILANMPDVLGISKDALCPDTSFELAQNETGTAEPCEHQLDLLVDVIDFLSSEHTEVSDDESYNEAAQTLLTIGNLAHLSQSAQNQIAIQDHTTGITSISVDETSHYLEVEIASKAAVQEENSATPLMSTISGQGVRETPETVATVELQNSTTDNGDMPIIETSDQRTGADMDPTPQLQSSPERSKKNSPQTRRGRLSKMKPKPNLGHSLRTAQSRSQPETSTVRTGKDTVAPDLSQATETAPKETPKIADCSQKLDEKDEISCIEVKLTEEPSGSQGRSVGHVKSGAATSDQSASENQSHCFSGTQFEPSLEQTTIDSTRESTEEILMSDVGTTKSSSDNLVTSDTAVIESQIGQGTNIGSASVRESSSHPTPCVTPVEDLPASQKEDIKDGSTHHTRQSRFQKTKVSEEKDSKATLNPKFHEKTIVEVEAEPTCAISPDNPSQSTCPASDLPPSLDLGSTLIPTVEVSTTESSCSSPLASNSAVPESQVGQRSNIDSAPVQESSSHPVPCVTHVEELPASQKEEGEDTSTRQTRRSRFQKVKPKPNLVQTSRTVHSKPQTTKGTKDKDSNPTPNPKFHEKTIVEVESEPTYAPSSEKPSQSTGPALDLIPSLDLGSTVTPTEEVSTTEQKKTDVWVVGQVESGAATSDQSASENQKFYEAQFEPSREQSTRDARPTSESTEEKLMSHVGTTERSCSSPLASDSAVLESQVGQKSNIDSAPVQESSSYPAPCVTPVEELPASQKEEGEDASICPTRRSRFQKVKPKPNLVQTSRTVHSKPQTTKSTVEKKSNPTPNPNFPEKTMVEVEAEPSCATSPGKPSQSTCPASDLSPSLYLDTVTPTTEEQSTTEKKKTEFRVACQVESGAATSDQSASENQNFPEAQFETNREQATRDIRPTSESTEEKLMSHVGTTESSCSNLLTSDSAVPESQVGQGSDIGSAPVQECSDHRVPYVAHVEELPASQKEESEIASSSQTRRGQLQKVKPKPNLPQTLRTVRSKPQTTKDPVAHMQLVVKPSSITSGPESTDNTILEVEAQPTCTATPPAKPIQVKSTDTSSFSVPPLELYSTHEPTVELSLTKSQKTDVALDSSSEDSEKNVPQRRQRFPKVKPKPNLRSCTRVTQTISQSNDSSKPSELNHMDTSSNVTSEQQAVENNDAQTQLKLKEKDSKHFTSTHCSSHKKLLSSTKLGPAESEKSLDSTFDKGTSSDGNFIATSSSVTENRSVLMDSVLENQSSEKSTVEGESIEGKVNTGPASQWDCKQDMSIRATETNTQPTDDPTIISDVQSSEDGSTESKIKSANSQSIPDPKESTQKPCSENDSEAPSQDAFQQCSETTGNYQTAAQSADDNESESRDSSKSSRKAPQIRRGRLVKPKPNLRNRSQPPQPQQVQNTKQAEADSGTCSESVVASEVRPDTQEPVEGAIEQHSNQNYPPNDASSSLGCLTQVIEQLNQRDSPPNVAGSSLGCLTQAPDNSTQNASTSSTGGTPSHPSVTIFPDMLLEQVPADPDEPFFILSLTEIPVSASGEMVDSASQPLPYFPATDASVQQQSSVPGEGLARAGEGPLPNVAVPVSMEESGETGPINVNTGSLMEKPVESHESTTVQPSISADTMESNDETERPPSKRRLRGSGRAAKLEVKPKTPRKKQASRTLAAKETESVPNLDSEHSGPSVHPKAFDEVVTKSQKESGECVDVEKETLTGGKNPEDRSSGAQTTQTTRTSTWKRNPKDFPSFLSEANSTVPSSDPTPGERVSKGPKVKTLHPAGKRSTPSPVASTSPTQSPEETHSPPSTTSPTQAEADIEQTPELCSDPTPSTSLCTAEVSASQCVESSSPEEEPTSVSQYFLTDIFTEVEEG